MIGQAGTRTPPKRSAGVHPGGSRVAAASGNPPDFGTSAALDKGTVAGVPRLVPAKRPRPGQSSTDAEVCVRHPPADALRAVWT